MLARGEGCVVWDADGNSYLDLVGGIAVSALGHAHPALVSAVAAQVGKLAHCSNLYAHEGQIVLAERLLGLIGADGDARVFFANSGTEANEAAVKLVRRAQGPARPVFVAAEHGFHGRSMGSLSLTGKESIREPFTPFGVDVRFVPYGDPAALTAAVGPDCAGVFLEPGLGEGGVVPAPPGYLAAARAACDASGALLVLDEIQSGIGRTGAWFAFQAEGIVPDVITLAKGLGGGLPIGACIGLGAAASAFRRGDHGSTFGGNPVACAAALAVLDTIESEGLLDNVRQVGSRLSAGIADCDHKLVTGVRGTGLWQAIELAEPAADAVEDGSQALGIFGERSAAGRGQACTAAHSQRRSSRLVRGRVARHPDRRGRAAGRAREPVRRGERASDQGSQAGQDLRDPGEYPDQVPGRARSTGSPPMALSSPRRPCPATSMRSAPSGCAARTAPWSTRCRPIGAVPSAPGDAVPSASAGDGDGPLSGLPPGVLTALGKVASDLLLSAEASGNLVVLKTPPGAAQLMASMIDRAGASAVLGTVAGDDTVLVVARDPLGGDALASALLRLAERRTTQRRGK